MNIPAPIKQFLNDRNQKSQSMSNCDTCFGSCCSGPGFALLENVIEIYKFYQTGSLRRDDFEFEKGINFCSFILKYFDRVTFNNSLLVFFPKSLSTNNQIISIPPWNYYEARDYIQSRIEKKGCIFLSKKLDLLNRETNFCILHQNDIDSQVTTKPVDCTFLQCSIDKKVVKPTSQETSLWFSLLDFHFPNSAGRFNDICPGIQL